MTGTHPDGPTYCFSSGDPAHNGEELRRVRSALTDLFPGRVFVLVHDFRDRLLEIRFYAGTTLHQSRRDFGMDHGLGTVTIPLDTPLPEQQVITDAIRHGVESLIVEENRWRSPLSPVTWKQWLRGLIGS